MILRVVYDSSIKMSIIDNQQVKVCGKCGDPEGIEKRTKQCIKRTYDGLKTLGSEKKRGDQPRLLYIGLDEVTITWCEKALLMADQKKDERQFILEIIADILTMSDAMLLNYPLGNGVSCPICSKELAECKQERVARLTELKITIQSRINYNISIDLISGLTHFGWTFWPFLLKFLTRKTLHVLIRRELKL